MSSTAPSPEYPCIAFANLPSARTTEPAQRTLRALLLRMLRAEARGAGISEPDLSRFNRRLARVLRRRGLVTTVRGYGWDWIAQPSERLEHEWQLLWSAARLISGRDRTRLRTCAGCDQLFLDRSRNASRVWCDMDTCGNRAKQRKWRERN